MLESNIQKCVNTYDHIEIKSEYETVMQLAKQMLSEVELKIFSMVENGYSFTEIGGILGMTKQGSHQKFKRASAKLMETYNV